MDVARCTADGQNYTAHQFEQLDEATLGRYRRLLICPECDAAAFFRKASRSGQAACFGARPHGEGCSLVAYETVNRGAPGDDQEEQINLGNRIEVDFDFGAQQANRPDPGEPVEPGRGGGRHVGGGGRRIAVRRQRLSTILRNLMLSDAFGNSDQLIAMADGEFRIRDFFVKFEDANENHMGEYRGYWGMLSDARDWQEDLWLNSGGRTSISIVVDNSIIDQFVERFRVRENEDLAGAYVLVFGILHRSANGKRYIACHDIQLITASLAS